MTERSTRQDEPSPTFLPPASRAGRQGDAEDRPSDAEDQARGVGDQTRGVEDRPRGVDDRAHRSTRRRGHHDDAATPATVTTHDRFGGLNLGAAFFGWLVAVALSVLLAGLVGAIAAAVGETLNVTEGDAEREADALGLAAGITLLVVLMIGYYAGGYVSGRMSRFDGARQGWGVWVIGVVITAVVALAGWIFGSEYDLFDRVDLPSVPIADDTLTLGGVVLAVAVLVGTLLAALAGGRLGLRYHHKVDRHTP